MILCMKQMNKPKMQENRPDSFPGYSQGGTVVDSVAYFTANSYQEMADPGRVWCKERPMPYPFAASFSLDNLQKLKTFDFEDTYDSSPLVYKLGGREIIIAHQFKTCSTRAIDVQTGERLWESAPNQPGKFFFGFTYYEGKDGLIIIVCSDNGLHGLDAATGSELWFFPSKHGVTPCVDQAAGTVYFQYTGALVKLDANTGVVIHSIKVPAPNDCVSWNTMFVKDAGIKIVTYWYGKGFYGSAIRVYNEDLQLCWEIQGIPASRKATLCYAGKKVYIGSGDHWQQDYVKLDDQRWKTITAYDINSGDTVWVTDLSEYTFSCLPNIIYCNGYLIGETQTNIHGYPYLIFVFDAKNGNIIKVLHRDSPANSCAPPVFSAGKLLSGDLISDSVLVTRLGDGEPVDWIGAFADGQTHTMAVPDRALKSLY